MISYNLPSQITHALLHGLVADLHCQLVKYGIHPASNMFIGDRDQFLEDGTTCTHFQLIISEAVADFLQQLTN
jgi:hypothetical protein